MWLTECDGNLKGLRITKSLFCSKKVERFSCYFLSLYHVTKLIKNSHINQEIDNSARACPAWHERNGKFKGIQNFAFIWSTGKCLLKS